MNASPASPSLGKRYAFKLVSNVATIPLFFILEAVLPRALGPAAYGNYNFITSLFQNFTNFLDMGTSACLYTSLSKRPGEFGLVAFYGRVALAVLVLCLLAGGLVFLPGAGEWLMPGVPLWMALPAALWAYITWAGRVARGMNDALGLTTHSEPVRVGVNVFSALLLLGLYFGGVLTLPVLFGHQYLTLGLLAAGFALCLRGTWADSPAGGEGSFKTITPPENNDLAPNARVKGGSGTQALCAAPLRGVGRSPTSTELASSIDVTRNPGRLGRWRLGKAEFAAYGREFWRYSGPLFVTALCSALALSGERWMLQFFNGSAEQGYFSLSQKVGMACFMFVSAMTPLITRDLAVAHGKGDAREMARLLDRFAPMLYAVSAWLACFTLAEAPAVVRLFGGGRFVDAVLPVQIMALYPIHQGYGQVAAAVFYATGETRLLRNVTLATLIAGLICAWVLLAPPGFAQNAAAAGGEGGGLIPAWPPLGGFGLGAAGLAWKMVGVQFVTVNLLLMACRRSAPFRYWRNLAHQVICPVALLALAFAARYGTEAAGLGQAQDIVRFLASGVCYCLFCLVLAFACPFVLGLQRGELTARLRDLATKAKFIHK